MVKRIAFPMLLILCLSLACNWSSKTPGDTKPAQLKKLCGDQVCNGPEDTTNCPQDCANPSGGQSGLIQSETGRADASNQPNSEGIQPVNPSDASGTGQVMLGAVFSQVTLDRKMGEGNCGISPWRPIQCQDIGPTQWWGQHLEAAITSMVLIVPDGTNRWVISNRSDVVSKYGYDTTKFFRRDGYYQAATVDMSVSYGCSGKIEGQQFGMQVSGARENEKITLAMSADPRELITGTCGNMPYSQNPSFLLYGWASALSGNPVDLTGILSDADKTSETGVYQHEFVTDTNPSPENRDHVKAFLQFMCVIPVEGGANPTKCPWE